MLRPTKRLVTSSLATMLSLALTLLVAPLSTAQGADPVTKTYAQALDFLRSHTSVLELKGENGAVVAICPELQGRVMTSSFAAADGPSLGWINYDFITAGKHAPSFNNYGGEDRFWLGPEGGQFGLFFQLENKQVVENWLTPPDINTGGFRVQAQDAKVCRLARRIRVTNVSEASFEVDVDRELRVIGIDLLEKHLGRDIARLIRDKKAKYVGFESANTATNVGPMPWNMQSGLVSIWSLGQFPAGDQTVIIVPYKEGSEQELGPVVQSDYFGTVPAERLKVAKSAILFRADGQFRSKIGVAPKRVRPIAGSVDLSTGVLTLVHFTLPDDPAAHFYVNNTWNPRQQNAYAGDVFNTYNDGPSQPGAKPMGSFYELETLSPTRPLAKGERLEHIHRTFHLQAEPALLAELVKATLGVELDEVRKFLKP